MSSEPIQTETMPGRQMTASVMPSQSAAVPEKPRLGLMTLQLPESKTDLVSNYRFGNPEDEVAISRAMAPCDATLQPYVGKTINVVGVVLNMATFDVPDSPGETIDKVYASIVLEDGTIVGTSGKAVMGQLAFLCGSAKGGPIGPPAEFEVRSHKSKHPTPYYSLRRVLRVGGAGKGKAK